MVWYESEIGYTDSCYSIPGELSPNKISRTNNAVLTFPILCLDYADTILEVVMMRVGCYYISFGSFLWIWAAIGYALIGRPLIGLAMLLIRFRGLILIGFVIVMPNGLTNFFVLTTGFIWYCKFFGVFNVWVLRLLLLLLVL